MDAFAQPQEAAKAAQLRYVSDDRPGIRRRVAGSGFSYIDPQGESIQDEAILARIKSLAIPPAWTDVWICPIAHGHLQATGRDAKGRKQHRYHPRWRKVRDETKYERMALFGAALPRIRERVEEGLKKPGLTREKVLATIVRLLETTFIRVGNEEYARANNSFGLTTLKNKHVKIEGSKIRFRFRGKSGKEHEITLRNRRIANLVRRCRDLPGQDLFQYIDEEGNPHPIDSGDVNDYLREISGEDFTAKDFRTWAGTLLAAHALATVEGLENATAAKSAVTAAVKAVAEKLGNTPAICRKCYIHPAILAAFQDEGLLTAWKRHGGGTEDDRDIEAQERALLRYLSAL